MKKTNMRRFPGVLLCLILAVFLCDRRRSMRKLSKIALVPAVFNMNELMMFGIPVVFNAVSEPTPMTLPGRKTTRRQDLFP